MPTTTPDLETASELKLWDLPRYGAVNTNLARMLVCIARQERSNRSHKLPSTKRGVVREEQ